MILNYSKIIELITNNEHETALEKMYSFAFQYAPKYINEITIHQSKLNALKSKERIGTISFDEYNMQIAKLTKAMLELLDDLKNVETTNNDNNKIKTSTFNENNLHELVCELYPKGIQNNRIWERSGGNLSYFNLNENSHSQWWDALKILKNGGGGNITFETLIAEIRRDYPNKEF